MNLQNLSETFWRSIKFFLLFVIVTGVLYIILTKVILKIPITDNQKLLASIEEFEQVLEKEREVTEKAKELHTQIKELEFDIYQVQKQDDIKREIFRIQESYKDNEMNSKYKFSLEASRILKIYFDTRENNSALKKNLELLSKNLTECQANI